MRPWKAFVLASFAALSAAVLLLVSGVNAQDGSKPAAGGPPPVSPLRLQAVPAPPGSASTGGPVGVVVERAPTVGPPSPEAGQRWLYVGSNHSQSQHPADALDRQTEALATQYGETADQEQRAKIKTELAELLAKQFDLQQQSREEELAEVEARVKKLRELIDKRKAAQRSIIENRLEQLLREAEGLGWLPPSDRSRATNAVRHYPLIGPARLVQPQE